ncbi:MAG: thioredoxin family protein [Melioribacteraceae bacterium]|nr:thioredoxin family protein [Melioribacteraceae bacterium]MCF8430852.1 thioredoxin family protein [Melioribacteraceae bacterium]
MKINLRSPHIFALSILIVISVFGCNSSSEKFEWEDFSFSTYDNAISKNQKIMIDFYADWCTPCVELDKKTYTDINVIKAAEGFVNLKADLTKTMSDQTQLIRDKFEVYSMPTILIISSNGEEIQRITEFIEANELVKKLDSVK